MRILLILTLSLLCYTTSAQDHKEVNKEDSITIIHRFIEKLANPNIATDVIMSQYLLVNHPSDEIYDYLEARLEEIRLNLSSKNLEDISYKSYQELPHKETKDIDLENINPQNIYFLYYNNKQILAIYIKDQHIASVSLVAKGNNKAHFVLY